MVLRGLTTIWSLATLPTSRSPLSLTATTLGRISDPLSLGTTRATLLRTYATQVLVVPRSIPSRMGFSPATALECYGAARPRRKKPAFLPPAHLVPDHGVARGRLDHLGWGNLSAGARDFESEEQRAAQHVESRLGRSLPVEARQHQSSLVLPLPREFYPAGHQRKEPIQVFEHRRGRLPEELEHHPQHRLQQAPAQGTRASHPALDARLRPGQLLQGGLHLVDRSRGKEAERPRRSVHQPARGRRDRRAHFLAHAALVEQFDDGPEERPEPLARRCFIHPAASYPASPRCSTSRMAGGEMWAARAQTRPS